MSGCVGRGSSALAFSGGGRGYNTVRRPCIYMYNSLLMHSPTLYIFLNDSNIILTKTAGNILFVVDKIIFFKNKLKQHVI